VCDLTADELLEAWFARTIFAKGEWIVTIYADNGRLRRIVGREVSRTVAVGATQRGRLELDYDRGPT
jgi:hypothetical protein